MKLHYVYYAIQKDGTPKVGASTNPKKRFKNKKYRSLVIIQQFDCPWKCGDKEIELQYAYFQERDNTLHYAQTLKMNARLGGLKTYKALHESGAGILFGEKNGNSKYTEEQARFVKEHHYRTKNQFDIPPKGKFTTKQLMDKLGVSKHFILCIIKGISWKHVKV